MVILLQFLAKIKDFWATISLEKKGLHFAEQGSMTLSKSSV